MLCRSGWEKKWKKYAFISVLWASFVREIAANTTQFLENFGLTKGKFCVSVVIVKRYNHVFDLRRSQRLRSHKTWPTFTAAPHPPIAIRRPAYPSDDPRCEEIAWFHGSWRARRTSSHLPIGEEFRVIGGPCYDRDESMKYSKDIKRGADNHRRCGGEPGIGPSRDS